MGCAQHDIHASAEAWARHCQDEAYATYQGNIEAYYARPRVVMPVVQREKVGVLGMLYVLVPLMLSVLVPYALLFQR